MINISIGLFDHKIFFVIKNKSNLHNLDTAAGQIHKIHCCEHTYFT